MERTEWLSLNSADARFLMLTAITHHTFSSPAWGEHEVRKLHAELAELDRLAAQAVADHNVARSGARRIIRPSPARRRPTPRSACRPRSRGSQTQSRDV